jgi:hypothetical protein
MQTCAGCGQVQFPARVRCIRCGSAAVELAEVDGAGTVYAKTVSRRAPEEAFAALVPYAVALIDLDVGVRVMARAGVAPDEVHTGARAISVAQVYGRVAVSQAASMRLTASGAAAAGLCRFATVVVTVGFACWCSAELG